MNAASLAASFFVSGVGFVLFSYGKKMSRIPQLAIGLVMMIAPYFAPSAVGSLLSGVALGGVLWLLLWRGL